MLQKSPVVTKWTDLAVTRESSWIRPVAGTHVSAFYVQNFKFICCSLVVYSKRFMSHSGDVRFTVVMLPIYNNAASNDQVTEKA